MNERFISGLIECKEFKIGNINKRKHSHGILLIAPYVTKKNAEDSRHFGSFQATYMQ